MEVGAFQLSYSKIQFKIFQDQKSYLLMTRTKCSYSRVKAHLMRIKGMGVQICSKITPEIYTEMQRDLAEEEERSKPIEIPLPSSTPSQSCSPWAGGSVQKMQMEGLKRKATEKDNPIQKAYNMEMRALLDGEIARAFYSAGLPFHYARNPHYRKSYTMASEFNISSYVPPSYNALRTTLLQKEKANVDRCMEAMKTTWKEKGVSIVSDGWSDPQRRPLINFMAVTEIGPMFLKAVNCEGEYKDKNHIANLIRGVIMEVGPQNVVQIVTDNAPVCKAAGMTEACSSLTFMTLYDSTKENSDQSFMNEESISNLHEPRGVCVGKTAPHVELKINSEDVSHAGRILVRGPHMMLNYWGQIPTTKESVPAHGAWFDTGDIGRLDNDGNVWLIGRTNGRIKSGGENVYPEEVEFVLSKHPGVARAVVVGLPDTRFAEIVVACIQLKPTWTWANYSSKLSAKDKYQCLSSEILKNFCKDNNLTGFKIPKYCILWTKALPLTTTGKLRRDQVRSEVVSHTQLLPSRL